MQSGAFGPGEEPAGWLPAADTSESLGRRALCSSVRAARAAKSRPGAGRQTGQQRTAASKSSFCPGTVTRSEREQTGKRTFEKLRLLTGQSPSCYPQKSKAVPTKGGGKKGSGNQTDSRRVPQQVAGRAPRRCPRTSGSAPRPLRCGGNNARIAPMEPPRPAQRCVRAAPRHSVPHRRPAPYRCEPSRAARRGEEPRRGRASRAPAAPWFPAGLPQKGPSGLFLRAPGFPGCRSGSCSRRGAVIRDGRAQGKPWSWERDTKGVRLETLRKGW